ncbi:MAG: hypothetical protein JSV91_04615, partial [Phycisphaerales bacterium]
MKRLLYLLALPFALTTQALAQNNNLTFIQIPTVVNIQTTADGPVISDKDAEEALVEANRVLAQAGIMLTWRRGMPGRWNIGTGPGSGNPADAGNDDGNSSMTSDERDIAAEAGGKELDKEIGKGKGVKVFFCATPDEPAPDNNGISLHKNRTVFIRPVLKPSKPLPPGAKPAPPPRRMTGVTLAHELCHAMSLGGFHTVANGVTADKNGHVPDEAAKTYWSNLMFPLRAPGYDAHGKLTPAQTKEIRKRAEEWGSIVHQVGMYEPAALVPVQSGGAQDGYIDATDPTAQDIWSVGAYSTADLPTVRLRVLSDFDNDDPIYPADGDTVRATIDTDGNPTTGEVFPWQEGVEREVAVRFFGDGSGPPSFEAVLIDHMLGGMETPIPDVEWELEEEFKNDPPSADPTLQRVELEIDKALLDLTADIVPVVTVSDTADVPMADVLEFDYDAALWAALPQLAVDPPAIPFAMGWNANPNFFANGLNPNGLATLFLDGEPIQTDLPIQPDGTVSGSFSVCGPPAIEDNFFVWVRDDLGAEAFNVFHVPPAEDDFESYSAGSELHGQGGWKGWDNDPAFSAPVTQEQSNSELQSIDIAGTADLVHEFCATVPNTYSLSAWQYIPSDFSSNGGGQLAGSFFIVLNTYDDGGPYHWSVQMQFDSNDGMLKVFHGDDLNTIDVPYATDRWVRIQNVIDLENDWTRVYYDDELIAEYSWTGGVLGDGGGALDIAAVDLYSNGSTSVYYDDLRLERIAGCDDPGSVDPDGDGLDNGTEISLFTDHCDADTDDDGVPDGEDNCPITFNPDQADENENGIGDACEDDSPCPADVNLDGFINIDDLFEVLGAWGTCGDCPEDVNDDGTVDIDDIFAVLAAWG